VLKIAAHKTRGRSENTTVVKECAEKKRGTGKGRENQGALDCFLKTHRTSRFDRLTVKRAELGLVGIQLLEQLGHLLLQIFGAHPQVADVFLVAVGGFVLLGGFLQQLRLLLHHGLQLGPGVSRPLGVLPDFGRRFPHQLFHRLQVACGGLQLAFQLFLVFLELPSFVLDFFEVDPQQPLLAQLRFRFVQVPLLHLFAVSLQARVLGFELFDFGLLGLELPRGVPHLVL